VNDEPSLPHAGGRGLLRISIFVAEGGDGPALVAQIDRPGSTGSYRRSWRLTNGIIFPREYEDFVAWLMHTITTATQCRLHVQPGLFRP